MIPTVAISVAIMSFLFNHGWWNPERDEQEFLGEDPEPLDEDDVETSGATATSDDDAPSGGGVATKTATVTRAQTPLIVLFAPMLAIPGAHRDGRDPRRRRHPQPDRASSSPPPSSRC